MDCFKEELNDQEINELFLDKTIIKFSLYKLNKDDDIKNILLENHTKIFNNFEALLFYFKSHYSGDNEILLFINKFLNDTNPEFIYLLALIFKFFPKMSFDMNIYKKYKSEKDTFWLVNYFMIDWLYHNDKKDFILSYEKCDNYFLEHKLSYFKNLISKDNDYKLDLINKLLLEDKYSGRALQGLSFLIEENLTSFIDKNKGDYNFYIKSIFKKELTDIINHDLKIKFKIDNSESFFNKNIWGITEEYDRLKEVFRDFSKFYEKDFSKAILNMNNFNNITFNKICEILSIENNLDKYGVSLDNKVFKNTFPHCSKHWTDINEKRNENAHPYDKNKKISQKISKNEFKNLLNKQIKSINEICDYNWFVNI